MEKNKPSFPLASVRELIKAGKIRYTFTAINNGASLGFGRNDIKNEIMNLLPTEFYKSMTTYNDHTIWQDVYRHSARGMRLYIKITVVEDVVVVSFKEL